MAVVVPTPRNSEAKLQHILRVSAQTFAAHGFEGTSMRDISKATEVSLSGLYYYFDSKQRLLYLIQKSTFTFIVDRLQDRLQGNVDPEAALRALVQNHMDYFLSHPNEMKVLSHEEAALENPFRQEVAAIKRKYFALSAEDLCRSCSGPRQSRAERAGGGLEPVRYDELGLSMASAWRRSRSRRVNGHDCGNFSAWREGARREVHRFAATNFSGSSFGINRNLNK